MLLAGLWLLAGTTTATAAAPHALRPQTPHTVPTRLASAAPSSGSQAAALAQLTGLSAGQVTTRSACPAPAPGQASCDAHVVVLRSTGAPVRPRVHRQQALADVSRGRHAGRPVAGAADVASTGLAAPLTGTPAWLQQAYDLSYLSANQGVGETIAVIDAYNDPTAEADLGTFRAANGLPACTTANGCFKRVNQYGSSSARYLPSTDLGWEAEEALDLDAVSSLCPNCHIILVEASSASEYNLTKAMAEAVKLGATQLSNSWSIVSTTPLSDQFTWPGVATVAATGDDGYNAHLSPYGAGDAYPAAAVGVTAAGGTTLAAAATGARGFGESGWKDAGSGCDTAETKPAYQTDTGCSGRSYADVSADADPNTGLTVYDTGSGGWVLMGGTSLATPLVAAYEAVTGVAGSTPAWAYTNSNQLNDPVSGSNGLCVSQIFYICSAGSGYDGPTGIGSISGQIATGGPGIGGPTMSDGSTYAQNVGQTSAGLSGGVYPNGYDTTYWWQYGPTTAYGETTPATDIGAGPVPVLVSDTLSDLIPSTTYHYRLVASNSAGTTYGYDYTLTTDSLPVGPNSSGSGTDTTTQSQTVTNQAAPTSPSTATTPLVTTTTTSTTTTPPPTETTPTSPVQTTPVATAPSHSASPTPPAVAPTPAPAPAPAPAIARAPQLGGAARVGATLHLVGGTYRNGTVTAVHFERCARTCATARGRGSAYRLTGADAGHFLRAWVTVSGPGGVTTTWAAGAVGPVRSKTAGAALLRLGAATVRGSSGRALARVTTRRAAVRSHRAPAGSSVELARVGAVRGAVRVWVCVLGATSAPSCSAPISVRRAVNVSITLRSGQRAELVALAHG